MAANKSLCSNCEKRTASKTLEACSSLMVAANCAAEVATAASAAAAAAATASPPPSAPSPSAPSAGGAATGSSGGAASAFHLKRRVPPGFPSGVVKDTSVCAPSPAVARGKLADGSDPTSKTSRLTAARTRTATVPGFPGPKAPFGMRRTRSLPSSHSPLWSCKASVAAEYFGASARARSKTSGEGASTTRASQMTPPTGAPAAFAPLSRPPSSVTSASSRRMRPRRSRRATSRTVASLRTSSSSASKRGCSMSTGNRQSKSKSSGLEQTCSKPCRSTSVQRATGSSKLPPPPLLLLLGVALANRAAAYSSRAEVSGVSTEVSKNPKALAASGLISSSSPRANKPIAFSAVTCGSMDSQSCPE
mmetsp:Transcript_30837/g.88645  ORF Transcript_30837/g.88645 Transcript_30837/m.88645 type:complete len:363 (+) Transcript_30837:737-1825(+)